MDCKLSSAYDRAPIVLTAESHQRTVEIPGQSYKDIIHTVFRLRHDWLSLRHRDPSTSPSTKAAERYLSRLETIESYMLDESQTALNGQGIQQRLEVLILRIYCADMKVEIFRVGLLDKKSPRNRRDDNFRSMLESMRAILRFYLALRQLSPLAMTSWDILNPVLSSALILVSFQRHQLDECDSSALLNLLSNSLSETLPDRNPIEIVNPSFRDGLKLLDCFLSKT